MSTMQLSVYELGPSNWRKVPKFYTKPTTVISETVADDGTRTLRHDTGGGYERVRSYEWRPHTSRREKEDVYASIHRLAAVAWCYPDDVPVGDILDDLHGSDVHHSHPDDWPTGVEWLNVHDSPNLSSVGLEVIDHGEHSEVTQAQMRSWAEDAKDDAADDAPDPDRCGACGDAADVLCASDDWDGAVCLECSKRLADGAPVEVL